MGIESVIINTQKMTINFIGHENKSIRDIKVNNKLFKPAIPPTRINDQKDSSNKDLATD